MANVQKRGNGWLLTVSYGRDTKGKYIRKTKTVSFDVCRTKKQAELEWGRFAEEIQEGEYIEPTKLTFEQFAKEWQSKYANEHLSKTTLEMYMNHLRSRVFPAIGHVRLDSFKTYHLVTFFDEVKHGKRKDGKDGTLSSGTVHTIHRAVKNIFSRAMEWGLIKTNPMDGIKKPKLETAEVDVYNKEQADLLFLALEREDPKWRMMVLLAAHGGLRRSELLGLEWKHVDFDSATIHIKQAVTFTKDGGYEVKEPKTRKSIRKIKLPLLVIEELRTFKILCNKDRLAAANLWTNGEHFFLFTGWNGKPLNPYSVKTWWDRFHKRHPNLGRIKFHGLRHTSATLLLNEGVHAKVISERLGHADIKTTLNIYSHVLEEADQKAADILDKLFSKQG